MTEKEIMNEYGDCTREQMLAYLTKIQNLQKKAAGKMTVDVHLLHDSGAIFGGVVREPEISICVTIMDVYDHEDYQKSWDLYQFYPANKNDELFADFKKDIEQFIKDFDKEWKRRRANYIKKKPNEIREEVRKQTAAKYKEEIERLKKLASDRWDNYMDATKRLTELHDENEQLKEKLAAQKDWIDRLMQFMDMPDEQRSKAVKEYVENKRMSEEFRELFSPYFETLNRLNILSW